MLTSHSHNVDITCDIVESPNQGVELQNTLRSEDDPNRSDLLHDCVLLLHDCVLLLYDCVLLLHVYVLFLHDCVPPRHDYVLLLHDCVLLFHDCVVYSADAAENGWRYVFKGTD